jgi:hypothetical protein
VYTTHSISTQIRGEYFCTVVVYTTHSISTQIRGEYFCTAAKTIQCAAARFEARGGIQ